MLKNAIAVFAALIAMSSVEDDRDFGSCISVPPVCMPGFSPVCLCDHHNECSWACVR